MLSLYGGTTVFCFLGCAERVVCGVFSVQCVCVCENCAELRKSANCAELSLHLFRFEVQAGGITRFPKRRIWQHMWRTCHVVVHVERHVPHMSYAEINAERDQ